MELSYVLFTHQHISYPQRKSSDHNEDGSCKNEDTYYVLRQWWRISVSKRLSYHSITVVIRGSTVLFVVPCQQPRCVCNVQEMSGFVCTLTLLQVCHQCYHYNLLWHAIKLSNSACWNRTFSEGIKNCAHACETKILVGLVSYLNKTSHVVFDCLK